MRAREVPLDRFPVLVLDMNSTFMFDEDRFGPKENFWATYSRLGGDALDAATVEKVIRAAYAFLDVRYGDPRSVDDFPSLGEALAVVAPELSSREQELLEMTFAEHERGTVPPDCRATLRALGVTHELRLLTNIWARKDPCIDYLSRMGVLPCFRRAIFSSDTRSVKPSTRLLEAALDGVACARGEVLMVGDSLERDMRPARDAGLSTLWVSPDPLPAFARALVDFHLPLITALAPGADR